MEIVGAPLFGVDAGFEAGTPVSCAVDGRTTCAESGEAQLVRKNVITNIELIGNFSGNRTIIICSNLHQTESAFASKSLQIEDFKN